MDEREKSAAPKPPDAPVSVRVTLPELKTKRDDLVKVKDALQQKYHQIIGQIELIDEIMAGKHGKIVADQKKE